MAQHLRNYNPALNTKCYFYAAKIRTLIELPNKYGKKYYHKIYNTLAERQNTPSTIAMG